jgi:hypothetical protein
MGYVGLKRGIWLYLPVIFIVGLYFYARIVNLSGIPKRLISIGFFFVIFSSLILIIGTMYSPSLNPDKKYGGTFDAGYLSQYAISYTFNREEDGSITYGRGANFQNIVWQMINKEPLVLIFGYGPESTKGVALYGEGIWGELGVAGPTPGIAQHLVSFGFVGIFLFLLIVSRSLKMLYKLSRIETSPYWKGFSFGAFMVVVVFLFDYFTYASSFIATIFPLSFTCAYILGVAHHRKKHLLALFNRKTLMDNLQNE